MSDVFADTSYFVALVSRTDRYHSIAHQLSSNRTARLVTTSWVLLELGNSLRHPDSRPVFLEIVRRLQQDGSAIIVHADQPQFDSGLELYAERGDKGWSLTDCISMELMRRMKMQEALTADRHFQQAGFRALLLESG